MTDQPPPPPKKVDAGATRPAKEKPVALYAGGIAVLVVLAFILIGMGGGNRSGTYVGVCQNLTYGGEADLILSLSVNGNDVSGDINITGGLGGSSPIKGVIDGNIISFTSDSGEGSRISWVGEIEDDLIVGEYSVATNNLLQVFGVGDQRGQWIVKK